MVDHSKPTLSLGQNPAFDGALGGIDGSFIALDRLDDASGPLMGPRFP